MTMTISEASAVNELLGYVLPKLANEKGQQPVTPERAKAAAAALARSAHRSLMAGFTDRDVAIYWQASPRRRAEVSHD